MDQKKSGLFIRDLRKEKGMSQKQFAAILNVSESAVCKWEKGVNLPDTLNLQTISDMFQITVNELLAGERMPVPELKLKLESEPDPSLKLTSELEANSGEYEEMNPLPEQKPESGLMPTTDSTDADTPPETRTLPKKRIWALCSLCIAGLVMIAFMVWAQNNTTPSFTIVESYYGASDEFNADAYGFKHVYWVMVEYTGELTEDSIRNFSDAQSRKFNEEDKLENVDAIFFEFYEDYSPTAICDLDFIVFLPLVDLDDILY